MEISNAPSDHLSILGEPNQHHDGPDTTTDTKSVHWEIDDPPPPPEARGSEEILKDLRNLVPMEDVFQGLELAREQLFAPSVMLHLAGEYYVKFGGPELVRKPLDAGIAIDSGDIHPTLSKIQKPNKPQEQHSQLPSFVFDIGRLYLEESPTYQPTDYRVVLDVTTGAIWLFYEYYQNNLDGLPREVQYQERNILRKKVHKELDSAMVLRSVKRWDDSLRVKDMERDIKNTGFMSNTKMTPATIHEVEDLLRTKRETSASAHQDATSKTKATSDVRSKPPSPLRRIISPFIPTPKKIPELMSNTKMTPATIHEVEDLLRTKRETSASAHQDATSKTKATSDVRSKPPSPLRRIISPYIPELMHRTFGRPREMQPEVQLVEAR